jgi:hypothetical protein
VWISCGMKSFEINHFLKKKGDIHMHNFNVRYKCLDARDDYRVQMNTKKEINIIVGSWDNVDSEDVTDDFQGISPNDIELDDVPTNLLHFGLNHKRHMKEMDAVGQMLTSIGWMDPLSSVELPLVSVSFIPNKIIPGLAWEQKIEKLKEKAQDKKNEHNIASNQLTMLHCLICFIIYNLKPEM